MTSSAPAELAYWRARAEALEKAAESLRRRLRGLVRVLPADCLPYLEMDLEALERSGPARELLDGWVETVALTPGDVRTELDLLWRRLREAGDADAPPPAEPR